MKKTEQKHWNLDEIYRVEDFDKLYQEIEKQLKEVDNWWQKIDPEMKTEDFFGLMEFSENLGEKISRLAHLPSLIKSINHKDQQARLMEGKADNLILKCSQVTRKINHWWKGLEVEGKKKLDDKNAKRLFAIEPDLEYELNYARLAAKHNLNQKEEEIIENKDTYGMGAVKDLREMIEADLVYTLGNKKFETQAELLKLINSPNSELREGCYRELFGQHQKQLDKFMTIYQAVVKDWDYEAKLRGYKSPISMRNFDNQISDEVIETLLKVCQEEKTVFGKYFKFKAELLGKKKLNRFDLYAPIMTKKERRVSFEESKNMVLAAYNQFSPEFAKKAQQIFDEEHIDSHPGKNKRSGAFCATVSPKISPYVMLNHTGTLRDVSTMAHEIGHAIHSLYANKHHFSSQSSGLPLAETASTLGELILFEKQLAEEKDKKVKRQMLSDKIASSYATILRQNYFVLFEIEAHKRIVEGITAEELSELYFQNLKDQFGSAVIINPVFKYEWTYISHIYSTPFYCYAYNFGELLALSLYAKYKKEGKNFIPKIEIILAAGGSEDPMIILKKAGFAIDKEYFWRNSFNIIRKWIEQLVDL